MFPVHFDFDHAEATFICDPAKVFPRAKPDKIPSLFDKLLGDASNHTFGVEPLIAIPKDQLKRIEIPALGLDCKGCSPGGLRGCRQNRRRHPGRRKFQGRPGPRPDRSRED